jgi:hypothetical protein
VTARYGDFLRASLPPFWTTTDPALVRAALRRLTAAAATVNPLQAGYCGQADAGETWVAW